MTTVEDTFSILRREVHGRLQDGLVDDGTARTVIAETVSAWQHQATQGTLRPLSNPERTIRRLERSVLGYGPLEPFLVPGSGIEEVMGNGADLTYLDGSGRISTPDETTTEEELRAAIAKLLLDAGRSVDAATPITHAQVLGGRGRLTVIVPPIAERFAFVLRLYTANHATLQTLAESDTVSGPAARFLSACMATPGVGVLVSGMPGAGKTTIASALLRAMPPSRRVIACEETHELSAPLGS